MTDLWADFVLTRKRHLQLAVDMLSRTDDWFWSCEIPPFCLELRFRKDMFFFAPRGMPFPPQTLEIYRLLGVPARMQSFPGSSVYDWAVLFMTVRLSHACRKFCNLKDACGYCGCFVVAGFKSDVHERWGCEHYLVKHLFFGQHQFSS